MSSFGDRFKNLRLSRNLTQDKLVEEFNKQYGYAFTKAAISQYENNKRVPEVNVLMKFVEYFNVSLDYLLCNDMYLIKELGSEYTIDKMKKSIELESILGIVNNLLSSNKVTYKQNKLNEEQIKIFKNCLEIAIELTKRNLEGK